MSRFKAYLNEGDSFNKNKNAEIDNIAKKILGIETLESRFSDKLDFYDLGVESIKDALTAAYKAGYVAGQADYKN